MWETNYAERLNYLNPLLFFSFKKLNDANSSSFIRFDWILHDSAVLFSYFENFLKFKRGDLISWGKPILQNGWIIWSSLLYFSFKKLNYPNSSSFIRFDWILHDSAVLFWYLENFHKFKKGDLIYWGGINYADWLNYLVPPLYINFKKLNDPNSSSHMRSFWLFRF